MQEPPAGAARPSWRRITTRACVTCSIPKTRDAAITQHHRLRQQRAEEPDRQRDHEQILDTSGFYDAKTVKQLMTRDDFRASLETQVKFFMDLKQIKTAPDLDKAIVTDLV